MAEDMSQFGPQEKWEAFEIEVLHRRKGRIRIGAYRNKKTGEEFLNMENSELYTGLSKYMLGEIKQLEADDPETKLRSELPVGRGAFLQRTFLNHLIEERSEAKPYKPREKRPKPA